MRSIPAPSPARKGKRRFLESCAITAGLIALAYGGPAMAQVQGTGAFVGGNVGNSITNSPGTSTTTVNTTGAQTIVNWTPTAAPVDGVIDFLPEGSTLNFRGDFGGYTVLNRFVSGTGTSIADTIALSGTVNSYRVAAGVPDQQGGNIWFYNAGGILVSPRAAINVGSLVLTANDIDTTGGLFGPGGEIRFRGANSNSAVTVSPTAFISADNGIAGGSYVALVAPRVVQNGGVFVDGSAAYVAAEQADITINGGLFDINVLVGANGGTVIEHGGVTGGPEQTSATNSNRIYMVAIPKNDAVTMLVSGQVGYQDAAVATQTDSNGSIVLSAGFNVTGGVMDTAPVNAVAANITVNDTIFRSDVIAHASGDFVGQPLAALPAPGGPFTSVPPPHLGRLLIQGNGTFIGDTSATLTINANRASVTTGNLTVQSPRNATVNVNGGQLAVLGTLTVQAAGLLDAATGNRTGGNASLSVTNGGIAGAGNDVIVSAQGSGGLDAAGNGGDGRGGTATITVSGPGSQLVGDSIVATANGIGGGQSGNIFTGITVADNSGDGFGGNASIAIGDGASVTATVGLGASANGQGRVGLVQSGNGAGGTARIDVTGTGTTLASPLTAVSAAGIGGGSVSNPITGTFLSLNAGDGRGGNATLSFGADATSAVTPGVASVSAAGTGGGANGENATGGDAAGGNATVDTHGGTVTFDSLTVDASATSGGASAPSAVTGTSGNAQGGVVNVSATNGSTLAATNELSLVASGIAAAAPNVGSGAGGDVLLSANTNGNVDIGSTINVDARGGSLGTVVATSAGAGTGGDVDLTADGGAIAGSNYTIQAGASVVNVTGTGGVAQGGTIDLLATNGGAIAATSDGIDFFIVDATTGISAGGSAATGGAVQLIANGGSLSFTNPTLSASGFSGGASTPGSNTPRGMGGNLLIQLVADAADSSAIRFGGLSASADGRTVVNVEGSPGTPVDTVGNGQGGSVIFDIQGGTLDSGSINLSADGYGDGGGSGTGAGRGGTVGFTQTGGVATISDLTVHADGFGGVAQGRSGTGTGGFATIDFLAGTITAANITAQANGQGGAGNFGSDADPAAIVAGGNGGDGQGGTATIRIDDTAVVGADVITASSGGRGGVGGDFFNQSSFSGDPGPVGAGGNGTGGDATVNLDGGTLTGNGVIADASGIGGDGGGSFFSSSSGAATGMGVGGNAGYGQGGTATIALSSAPDPGIALRSVSRGTGGTGGAHNVGGNGGGGFGGTAQAIITGFDAGPLALTLDSTATGGNGGDGRDGNGGDGGNAVGGTSRMTADGANAGFTAVANNFLTNATAGNGGNGNLGFGAFSTLSPDGGDGGFGQGGTIEIVANEGGIAVLAPPTSGTIQFNSTGNGGDGGRGADNSYSDTLPGPDGMFGTADDQIVNANGGNGGIGGGGTGGTVHLLANGGTITSNGAAVSVTVAGASGDGGDGGFGPGAGGNCCSFFGDLGGKVLFESFAGLTGPGQISLGDTTINANGASAGRIEIISNGNISMNSLTASALGFANPTNLDTDSAPAGIFINVFGGAIQTSGALSLTTDSSVGVYAQAGGGVNAGGDVTIQAGDEVDIRHDFRTGTAPTIAATGSLSITAPSSIRAQLGSVLSAGAGLSLNATGANGSVNVDGLAAGTTTLVLAQNFARIGTTTSGDDLTVNAFGVEVGSASAGDDISLTGNSLTLGTLNTDGTGLDSELDGSNIFLGSVAATTVEHAEADNGFTANVGSFRTGLNSIITGGSINITAAGLADLGNSTAGGFVSVEAGSIAFNNIDAGTFVALSATGTGAADGVTGAGITAGSGIGISGQSVDIGGTVATDGSLTVSSSVGAVNVNLATVGNMISVDAAGDLTGTYNATGSIALNSGANIVASANATGFESSSSGPPIGSSVFADAAGNANFTGSSATGMFGVNAGGAISANGVAAGEDVLMRAGTTATLTNVSAGDDLTVQAVGNIVTAGLVTTGAGPDDRTLGYNDNPFSVVGFSTFGSPANGSNIDLTSTTGSIGVNGANAFDNLTATAATVVNSTGQLQSGLATSISGANVILQSITAGTDIDVTATTGAISANGALAAGRDVTATAAGAVNISELDAGDDVRINSSGALTIGAAYSYGTGADSESDGSNIVLTGGVTNITHAEADNDFIANAASFRTGLDSIITGGDILVASPGAVDLGNSTAGGSVSVTGQSIAFNNIDAGTTVGLSAAGTAPGAAGITGGSIVAGGSVTLDGLAIAIANSVRTSASLFATATGGNVSIASANADGAVGITADGNIAGSYAGGGNIVLTASGDIVASVASTGGYTNPLDLISPPAEGFALVNADGNVTLTNSSAVTMLGVRAGQAASVNGATAGEDVLVVAGATATLTNVSAGDDLTVTALRGITANNVSTTGTGPDGRTFSYGPSPSTGIDSFQVTTTPADLSNIVLTATAGNIGGGNISAFDNLTATASGTVATTGLLRSGRATTIRGGNVSLAAVTAGTNIALTATSGGVAASGTLAAGRDLAIAAPGAVTVSALDAGDDIRITNGGALTIGVATARGTAPDNDGDGSSIVANAGGVLQVAGSAQAANGIQLQGGSVSVAAFDAGGDAEFTAVSGDLATGGGHAGGSLTFAAAGDISHAGALLDAGNVMTLSADGDIAIGDARSGDNMIFDAGGAIDANALTAGRVISLTAADAVTLTGAARSPLLLGINGSEVELNAIAIDTGNLQISATNGGVHAEGTIAANGGVAVDATGAVAMTGDINAATNVTISGASVNVGKVTGDFGGVSLVATNGAVNAADTIDAGQDIFISTTQGGTFTRLIAADDIGIVGSGNVDIAFMDATGDNPQGEEVGSNVGFDIAGNVHVDHAEAADDFIANVTGFSTGLNSIVTGGNVEISATDAVDLGNTTAGGHVAVGGQSIAFNTIDAGAYVDLDTTGTATPGAIAGSSIIAGSDVRLAANSIDIASITGAASLSAVATGGTLAIDTAAVDGNIGAFASGNLSGSYAAGGDISLSSGANINATANASGGYFDPSTDTPSAGNVFVDAAGNVTMANSSAAGDFGVNGRAITLANVTAGEDMLVLAATTANLTAISAGDDLDGVAAGAVTVAGASATGAGPDGLTLTYSQSNGFTIGQGEGVSSLDGADIDLRSTGGAVTASTLSAGDDIFLRAATTLAVNGATTRGIGQTGGASNIQTQSGDATLTGLNAFTDLAITSTGAVDVAGPASAGRDIVIAADSLDVATLMTPAGSLVDTLVAGRDLTVDTAAAISGGAVAARSDATLTAGTTIDLARVSTGNNGDVELEAADGIAVDGIFSQGATSLDSSDGAIIVNTLSSSGAVNAHGDSVTIAGSGDLAFAGLTADVGDATVRTDGDLTVANADVAGLATLGSGNGGLTVTSLTAANTRLESLGDMALTNVSVDGDISVYSQSSLLIDGIVTGESIGLASTDIAIGANARVGTAGITGSVRIANDDDSRQTFIGGNGTGDGYNIDAGELARVYGSDINIGAPAVDRSGGRFIGTVPPDVVIDDFTMTAGSATSNLGANGTLTIDTSGTARVVGDVALTGMTDNNAFNISADRSLEVILGDGSIRLTGASDTTPGGQLNLASDDVIVATLSAIDDVAAATTTDAIDARLAQNDGVMDSDGALYARGIRVGVFNGFYVQNSGAGADYAARRGLTFGAGGLNVNTEGSGTRIVINGVHLGPNGQVTGLDTIPLLTVSDFDPRSTFNGCLIANTASCSFIPPTEPEFTPSFPVQDVIEEETDGDDSDGMSLPTALITMRDLDPLSGEPLLDDPVTGAGNDDLWTPSTDQP